MKPGLKRKKSAGIYQILLLGLSCLLFLCSGCAGAGKTDENADAEARSDTQNTDTETADTENTETEASVLEMQEWAVQKMQGEEAGLHYTFTDTIKVDEGRELTLKFYCAYQYRYGYRYGVRKIEVFEGDKLLQTILTEEAVTAEWGDSSHRQFFGWYDDYCYTDSWTEDGGLDMRDMNFDGAGDIGLMGWITTGANIPYYYWLWDAETEEFRYAFCLANPELDQETEQIVCWTRDGAAASETCYFEYDEDGNLQMVREVYYHYDWETDTDTVEVWELQNGEWLQVE